MVPWVCLYFLAVRSSLSASYNFSFISHIMLIMTSMCVEQFVNIDGFNCGEKAEMFWGIRAYEIAISVGLKFYVWGNLDYASKKGNFDQNLRCGHYDGKGRVGGR
jgi:hypothetical protein